MFYRHDGEKKEKMRGISKNEQAFNTLENLLGSIENRIREIYNQGYQQGFEDGVDYVVVNFTDKVKDTLLKGVEDDKGRNTTSI